MAAESQSGGGVRAVEQLRQVAIELDMVPIRRQIAIARVWTAISEDGALLQPPIDEAHALLDDIVRWATTVRTGRSVAQVA
jgi:NAD(P)H-dependent FMN reductase